MENQLHLLTGAYALNAVTAAERADFERHALGNPETRDEVRSLSETAALLAYGTPTEVPPPELKANVMAAIRNTRQLPASSVVRDISSARGTSPQSRRASQSRRHWNPAVAAAAALVLVGGVGLGGWAMGQSAGHKGLEQQVAVAQAQQARQAALLAIMAAPDAKIATTSIADGGTVTVASSGKVNQAAVMASGLPVLPTGKTYELWFISATGAVPAGLMPGATGTAAAMQVLNGELGGATHVGITVEPDGGSPKPTTTPILVQSV
ncbi:anti-sigma factor [Arthrobacter livingstonensis]|uniref:Regulator of SigK n=1 Tax=Arthrobacter livingstonensis TaxID=670078 RepID=A0A2V5LNJ8_9MICC|nr:anti-sigma factor [Arthrobacter livingstonensis]PYI69400.1 anti-sigma factor [Arthrobacter livingstonensis]